MAKRRKTFSGSEQDANDFIRSTNNAIDGQRVTLQALQAQVSLGIRIGMPDVLGITDAEFARQCYEPLGGMIQLSIENRREAVARLTAPVDKGGEGLSQRETAAVLGVSQRTVSDDVRGSEQNCSVAIFDVEQDCSDTPESQACEECGTPTLPLWTHLEEEFVGRLLCGRCAEHLDQANGIRAVEPEAQEEEVEVVVDERAASQAKERVAQGKRVWQALLELSGCREIELVDVVEGLPEDRLPYTEPIADALIAWLGDLTAGVRERQARQPVGLAAERIKRGKEQEWLSPA